MPSFTGGSLGVTWGYVPHEDGWADSYNLNFQKLDAVVHLAVISILNTPPGSPAADDRYIVGPSPTGAWVGHTDHIAVFTKKEDPDSRAWVYFTPKEGWRAWNVNTQTWYQYDGADWVEDVAELPSGGTDGDVLTKVAGVPAWAAPSGGGSGFDLTEGDAWDGAFAFTKGTIVSYADKRYIASIDIPAPAGTPGLDGEIHADGTAGTLVVNGLDTAGTADIICVVAAWNHDGTSLSSIVSTSGLTFTQRASQVRTNISGHRLRVEVWTAPVSSALTNEDFTITLSNGAPSDFKAVIFGIYGGDVSNPVDVNADSVRTNSGDRTAPGITAFSTTNADDLLVFVAASDSDGSSGLVANTAPAGWTLLNYQGNATNDNAANTVNLAVSTKLVSATQSAISVSDGGDPSVWGAIAIAFKASGAANLSPDLDDQWIVIDEGVTSALLDGLFGSTTGTIIVRGASLWEALSPGSEADILTIIGGEPSWEVNAGPPGGAGGGLFYARMGAVPTSAGTGLTTWQNQGTASVADTDQGVVLTVPAATENVRMRKKASPTPPYVISALVALDATWQNFQFAGIGWTDGTKYHLIYLKQDGNLEVGRWNTATSFSTAESIPQLARNSNPIWLQIEDDGTNVYFRASASGKNYVTLFSISKASGFLGSSGYSSVGFAVNRNNNTGTSTAYGVMMAYDQV